MRQRRTRKETAWKKSRKFGDVYGGRAVAKITDRIFRRVHSLSPPAPGEKFPILVTDNPSRDYFFPISAKEAATALEALPQGHAVGITHLWLRRLKRSDDAAGGPPRAEYICGSGVRAVVLYGWRKDGRMVWGRKRPDAAACRTYGRYGGAPVRSGGWWYFEFRTRALRRLYIEFLLYHEVGHHVDSYRRAWTKANRRKIEEFADQYAMRRTTTATHVLNRLEDQRTV